MDILVGVPGGASRLGRDCVVNLCMSSYRGNKGWVLFNDYRRIYRVENATKG